jgi:hypothetical protein
MGFVKTPSSKRAGELLSWRQKPVKNIDGAANRALSFE